MLITKGCIWTTFQILFSCWEGWIWWEVHNIMGVYTHMYGCVQGGGGIILAVLVHTYYINGPTPPCLLIFTCKNNFERIHSNPNPKYNIFLWYQILYPSLYYAHPVYWFWANLPIPLFICQPSLSIWNLRVSFRYTSKRIANFVLITQMVPEIEIGQFQLLVLYTLYYTGLSFPVLDFIQ